jgi:hypothetical protein
MRTRSGWLSALMYRGSSSVVGVVMRISDWSEGITIGPKGAEERRFEN